MKMRRYFSSACAVILENEYSKSVLKYFQEYVHISFCIKTKENSFKLEKGILKKYD